MPSDIDYFIDIFVLSTFLNLTEKEHLEKVWKAYQSALTQITSQTYKALLPAKGIDTVSLDKLDSTEDPSSFDVDLMKAMTDPEIINALNLNLTDYNKKIYDTYFPKLTKEQQITIITYSSTQKKLSEDERNLQKEALSMMSKILKDNNVSSYEELVKKNTAQTGNTPAS